MALAMRFSSWIHQTLLQQVTTRIRSLREALVGQNRTVTEVGLGGAQGGPCPVVPAMSGLPSSTAFRRAAN